MTGPDDSPTNAAGDSYADWIAHMARIGADHGFFDTVAPGHRGLFVQEGDTLVVSFDQADTVFHARPRGLPLGFGAVQARQVSLLSIMAEGPTWFRAPDLYAFFDALRDQGFFDSFEKVVFLGAGPRCGHAACVYSSAVPGATVIVSRPAATLSPAFAGFDTRFRADRRLDFTTRYGDAPALTAEAAAVVVLHDPTDPTDAAHAAQFRGAHVLRLPLRFRGALCDDMLADDRLLVPLIRSVEAGDLSLPRAQGLLRPIRRAHAESLLHMALHSARHGKAARAAVFGRAAQAALAPKSRRSAEDLMARAEASAPTADKATAAE